MSEQELIEALKQLKVQTGSLVCLGCYHEHSCSTRGCAIIRAAVEELSRYEKAEQEGRMVKIPEPSDDGINDPLEPMKIWCALNSEVMKLMYHKENNPSSISQLDYTIIAALEAALKERKTDGLS